MEDNFEEHIKDFLDDSEEWPLEERLWKDMKKRLKESKEEKKSPGLAVWLPLVLFSSLIPTFFAGYFYMKHNAAIEKIAYMEKQSQRKQFLNIDTIQQKYTTVIYDTIYNQTVINQDQQSGISRVVNKVRTPSPFYSSLAFYDKNANSFFENELNPGFSLVDHLSALNGPYAQRYSTTTSKQPFIGLANLDTKTAIAVSALPSIFPSSLAIDNSVRLPLITSPPKRKHKKNVDFYLMKLTPTNWALSGSAGQSVAFNFNRSMANFSASLQSEIGYGDQFSLVFGGTFLTNDFKIKKGEEEEEEEEEEEGNNFAGYPELSEGMADDVIHEIYGNFKHIQIPFGFKYKFLPEHRFRPYIGIGLLTRKSIKSSLRYEYISNGMVLYENKDNLLPKSFELSAFWSTLGIQMNLKNRWGLFLEGKSQFDLNPGTYQYENLQLVGWSMGAVYQFD